MANWIIPSNPNKYKMVNAFMELGMIDQSTRNKIKKGDSVFIYQSSPICKIILETIVIDDKVNSEHLINDAKFYVDKKSEIEFEEKSKRLKQIRLKLVKYFDKDTTCKLTLETLRENGYKGKMQGAIKSDNNRQLFDYIESVAK